MMRVRSISVPDILWNNLKALADSKGISISEVIRRASEDYVDAKSSGHKQNDRVSIGKVSGS